MRSVASDRQIAKSHLGVGVSLIGLMLAVDLWAEVLGALGGMFILSSLILWFWSENPGRRRKRLTEVFLRRLRFERLGLLGRWRKRLTEKVLRELAFEDLSLFLGLSALAVAGAERNAWAGLLFPIAIFVLSRGLRDSSRSK